jgi:hypothetical protein
VTTENKRPKLLATRNQRLGANQKCIELLIEDLNLIFSPKRTSKEHALYDIGIHNLLVSRLTILCPNIRIMLKNVAKAILRSAKSDETEN